MYKKLIEEAKTGVLFPDILQVAKIIPVQNNKVSAETLTLKFIDWDFKKNQ